MDNSLLKSLCAIGSPRILIFGDLMLDRYTWGNVDRVSPEAPVLVLQADEEEVRLGGAASVAGLLRALDAQVTLAGVVGDDLSGRLLLRLLKDQGIDTAVVVTAPDRITTTKERLLGRAAGRHPSQILRVDREVVNPISDSAEEHLLKHLASQVSDFDAVLISDYGKGVCTLRLLRAILEAGTAKSIPVAVDPAISRDVSAYRGASVLLPNRREAELTIGRPISSPEDALEAGEHVRLQSGSHAVMVKLDKEGVVLAVDGEDRIHFPTKARTVCDVTGAGDMVLAVVGLCCASGVSLATAAQLANVAAGLEVEELGVVPISRQRLEAELKHQNGVTVEKITTVNELAQVRKQLTQHGKTLVLTNGCFDLLHVGHVSYLREAAGLGDVLAVAINTDRSVSRLKGPGRPVVKERDRAALISALECVDYVLFFDENMPHNLLRQVRPDVLVKGGTYAVNQVVGREVVEAYGGRVLVTGHVEGVSTTHILETVKCNTPCQSVHAEANVLEACIT